MQITGFMPVCAVSKGGGMEIIMDVTITPSVPTGSVKAPPGKSMAHRLLIAAGLCAGTSTVRGVSLSEDVLATIDCLRALGAEVGILEETGGEPFPAEAKAPAVRMLPAEEKIILVRGTDPARAKAACLPCRESGSTLRFFAPLCMLSGEKMRLEGSRTLLGRPLFVYEEICREQKILFQKEDPACAAQIYSEQEILFQKGDPACAAPGGALEDQGSLVPGGALAGQGNPAPGGALLVQGIATSIDALSVGFTIAEYPASMALTSALIIALVTFFICLGGLALGKRFGTRLADKAAILGGLILIGIGLEIFLKGLLT